jgi:hypothetical protein
MHGDEARVNVVAIDVPAEYRYIHDRRPWLLSFSGDLENKQWLT